MKLRFLALTFLLWSLLLTSSLLPVVPSVPDQPANYVVDLAGIIDPQTEANLNRRLKELEDRTTAQMVVLTIKSLEGEPIEKFSLATAQKWALGQKGKDNGVLITIVVQDRKYRIEVGYGLEVILPDSYLGSLARQHFVPNFRQGNYSQGIEAVVSTIAGNIRSGEVPQLPKAIHSKEIFYKAFVLFWVVFFLLAGLFIMSWGIYEDIKQEKKKGSKNWWLYGQGFDSSSGGGFGGGGFGGGGGGFGGGGGGGFGGGGCSGGW